MTHTPPTHSSPTHPDASHARRQCDPTTSLHTTFIDDPEPQPSAHPAPTRTASSPPPHPDSRCADFAFPTWNSTTRLLARAAHQDAQRQQLAHVRARLAHDPQAQHAIAHTATQHALNVPRSRHVYPASGISVRVERNTAQVQRAPRAVDEAYLKRVRETKPTVAYFMGTKTPSKPDAQTSAADDYLLAQIPLLKSVPLPPVRSGHAGTPPAFVTHELLTYHTAAELVANDY